MRGWQFASCLLLGVMLTLFGATAVLAARIHLKTGLALEGDVARIGTLIANPVTADGPGAGGELIVLVDDDLRRIYIPFHQIREVVDDAGKPQTKFEIPNQPVAQVGNRLISLGPILNRGAAENQWDSFGRRTIEILTTKGPADVVQGITLVTPQYYRVQTLRSGRRILIDQRFATKHCG